MDGHSVQHCPFQPGNHWPRHVQRERVFLGDVQDVQAVQTDGDGVLQTAGHLTLPCAVLTDEPDSAAVGRLSQCADMSSGPGLGEQPHQ